LKVKTVCLKCGTEITLDFGDMTLDEAMKKAEEFDRTPRECPGWHVELGGWIGLYQIGKALLKIFPEADGDPRIQEMVERADRMKRWYKP